MSIPIQGIIKTGHNNPIFVCLINIIWKWIYFAIIFIYIFFSRSSITRLSVDDKAERSKAVSSQERDLLLHKTIEERKGKQIMLIIKSTTPTTFFVYATHWYLRVDIGFSFKYKNIFWSQITYLYFDQTFWSQIFPNKGSTVDVQINL